MALETLDDDLLAYIGALYDCAVDPALWTATLQKMAELFDARSASISLHNPTSRAVHLQMHANLSEKFQEMMEANMAINPLVSCFYYYDIDQPFSAFAFVGEQEMRNSRWSLNTVVPAGYGDAAFTILAKSKTRFGALAIMRDAGAPLYGDKDLGRLALLAPHIRRAAMIADVLDQQSLESAMLATTLDLIHAGVFLTNDEGRIVRANSTGSLLLEGAVLHSAAGYLRARDAESARALARAITCASGGTTAEIPSAGFSVTARAPDGHDLAIWVLPLDSERRQQLGASLDASVAVFIRELGDTSLFPAELFIQRYAITPAECRLLVFLTQGMSPKDAAEALGISMATGRTHIARLLAKTGSQSLTDLMRLAVSALAPASASSP